jgi:hypothetical protein
MTVREPDPFLMLDFAVLPLDLSLLVLQAPFPILFSLPTDLCLPSI